MATICVYFSKKKKKKKRDCKSIIIIIISKKYCFFFLKNKNAVNDERIYKNQLSVIVDCHYSLLGVCMVRLVQFFLKFITKPIGIGIYIIGTDAHRLKSIFWLIAVWSNKKNKKIKLRLSHCIKIPFPFRYYMCLFFKKEKEKKKEIVNQ